MCIKLIGIDDGNPIAITIPLTVSVDEINSQLARVWDEKPLRLLNDIGIFASYLECVVFGPKIIEKYLFVELRFPEEVQRLPDDVPLVLGDPNTI
jgi:hypothetical protein